MRRPPLAYSAAVPARRHGNVVLDVVADLLIIAWVPGLLARRRALEVERADRKIGDHTILK
jgi:hypothetical protein